MYEVTTNETGFVIIKKTEEDGSVLFIPEDTRNRHYQEYLRYTEWVEAGNDPDEFWSSNAV